jgi:ribA/ribD-fused uncharacterized protein
MAFPVHSDIYAKYFLAFSAHPITFNGIEYPTVEHAYHCLRYDDPAVREYIRSAPTPLEAWERSQAHKHVQTAGFPERKRGVMKMLCRLKLEQHPDVRSILRGTGDADIVKHVSGGPKPDGFWDDGEDGTGQNEAGKIWMELREELLN